MPKSMITGLICLAAATSLGPAPAFAEDADPAVAATQAVAQPAWKPWRMRIEFREGRYLRSTRRYATKVECEAALEQEIVNFVTMRRSTRAGHCVADGIEA